MISVFENEKREIAMQRSLLEALVTISAIYNALIDKGVISETVVEYQIELHKTLPSLKKLYEELDKKEALMNKFDKDPERAYRDVCEKLRENGIMP